MAHLQAMRNVMPGVNAVKRERLEITSNKLMFSKLYDQVEVQALMLSPAIFTYVSETKR